jgi:catechol 2,3-dioxygenase-like lactoylglutathione lyase family enzyme
MKIKLHEVELFSQDPQASRAFYANVIGLDLNHSEDGLNVFDTGWAGVDFDTSRHMPGKQRLGFVVESLEAFRASLAGKQVKVEGPMASHLGMRILRLEDPDGNIVEVQELSTETPGFLRQAHSA